MRRALWKIKDLARCFHPGRFGDNAHHYDERYARRMDDFAQRSSSQDELDATAEAAELGPSSRVLDFGCNTGRLAAGLVERTGASVVGLDRNEAGIEAAREMFPDMEFVLHDGEPLPFGDGTFDHVMMNHVIGHVPDPAATIAEIHRVLSTGGSFSVITPNRWYKLGMTVPNLWNRYTPDPTVLRYYTADSLATVLHEAGFAVERREYCGEPSFPFGSRGPACMRMRVFCLGRKLS